MFVFINMFVFDNMSVFNYMFVSDNIFLYRYPNEPPSNWTLVGVSGPSRVRGYWSFSEKKFVERERERVYFPSLEKLKEICRERENAFCLSLQISFDF